MAIDRRRMMSTACTVTAGLALGIRPRAAAPRVRVESTTVISMRPNLYHGWPTMARRRSGELLLVASGGREAHVCPFGWVELMRSKDDGNSWSFPEVLHDSVLDDRDAGVLETAKGTLLVTTFTSVGYEKRLAEAETIKPGQEGAWSEEKLRRWHAAHRRVSAAERQAGLGSWMLRSTDGGVSWSAAYRCQVNSPHGPIQLGDGRLLYAGKQFPSGGAGFNEGRIGVCESIDDGLTWRWLAEIPTRSGDRFQGDGYSELHAVEAANGTIVAHIRNHNKANEREILQSESTDGGKSWSTPHPIGAWGLPSHLLRLKDGRLLMSYGHRRPPLGVQARISENHGLTWSEALVISGDGTSTDLGYPSTVELDSGTLLTVWYELMNSKEDLEHYFKKGRDREWFKKTEGLPGAALRQARWRLAG
ncbi:MAG: exo-alpha-sialidase [Acidimicrobiia bacterium]|nr:exo-alpha-sialidase [Acidimicrobiia bacterium]